jgi:tetratricopeptide (TPR) repeat protein
MLAAEQPDADSLRLEIAGVFEYRANAPDSAVRYLDSYLARRPDDHAARLRLARLHAWSGRIGEAEAAVQAVLERRPADAEAWALLGDLHRWRGESERAEAAYRRALALDPEVGGAAEGLAALDAQLDAELAARGSAGPGGTLDYFADSDGFRMARWRGGYRLGTPRQRWGVEVGVEHLAGHDRDGQRGELEAVEATALAERWWSYGRLSGQAALGVWIAGSDLVEPLLVLALSTPDWGNAAYRIEYRHEPGYRQTSTYEAAAADLRADVLGFEYYRPLGPRWEASAGARLAHFSGLDATNLRGDVSLAFLYAAGDGWLVGYESRGLGFSDAAPRAARPLYWDPEWYWLNAALARWTARRDGLEIMAQGSAGVAWMREREMDSEMAAQFALALDVRRRLGDWTLVGRAALSQSRADGYRAFRFDLGLSRGFAR